MKSKKYTTDKAKEQLIRELEEMHQQLVTLRDSATKHKEAEEKLQTVFNAFPDLYFRLDRDGTILDYSVGHTAYLYVPPEVFIGKRMQDVLPPNVGHQVDEAIVRVLRTDSLASIEYSLPMPHGEQSYEARLLPYHKKQIIVIVRDITQRKKAAEEIKKLNEDLKRRTIELEAANKELEAFSYSVTHDLRTPLLLIDGFSRKLLQKYSDQLDPDGQHLLNVIRANTQHMWQLIDDLLTFSHIGHKEMETSMINMEELVRTVMEELKPVASGRTLQWRIATLPPARGDRAMIRQVLMNLLSNAIKFTKPREETVIEVSGKAETGHNIYYVKDNGVGFDTKLTSKLFDVFQRLHSSDEFEGTGVGLAIVQRIIYRHGGLVWAEGKVNEGATFYFTLPRGEP